MDQIYTSIVSFQYRVNDYIDDPSHPAANALKQAVQRLEDDVQVRKNAHSIEDQLTRVEHALHHAGREQVMSQSHVNELVRQCEHFEHEIRKFR